MRSIAITSLTCATLLISASCERKPQTGSNPADTAVATSPSSPEEPFVLVPRMVRDDGSFELLTLIEGVEANKQFVKNLQLVRGQRLAVKNLKETPDKSGEAEKKLQELEAKLQENIDLMVKIYGYDISSDYVFIPLKAALIRIVDGKKELIRKIESPAVHHKLQTMRGRYAELVKKDGEASADAQAVASDLLRDFGCDVKSACDVEVIKGALYRKVH